MVFPQNNIIIHSATVAKYMNELVMQYSNDENIIVFNGCPSQSIPPIGLLMLGHWFCITVKKQIVMAKVLKTLIIDGKEL